MLALGILDQSPCISGQSAAQSLQQSLELAKAADRLGFSRFLVSEHHNTINLAGSAPEVLIAAIAAHTKRIRVGSGGVLLPHYSPYKVAETFRLLEGLYPNRIDLGIGRAPGGEPIVSSALRYGRPMKHEDHFKEMLKDLAGFLTDQFEEGHRYKELWATPLVETIPECWLLGSSTFSSKLAAELGGAFSYAHFLGGDGREAVHRYYEQYRPGPLGSEPRSNVCVYVICAESDEEAERLAVSIDLSLLWSEQGKKDRFFPSPEEAISYIYSGEDLKRMKVNRNRMIVGGPDKIKRELVAFSQAYGVNEIIVLSLIHDFSARLRSYEILADLFTLNLAHQGR